MKVMPSPEASVTAELAPPRTIAVLSGKGGTGKTMIAAALASVLDKMGLPVTVMDADTGTGGMTYYLGAELVRNTAVGLADVIEQWSGDPSADRVQTVQRSLQPIEGLQRTLFFGVGDHWRVFADMEDRSLAGELQQVVALLKDKSRWLVIDCRGGIDHESLAVCREADDIILIVEQDITSFQVSRHVVDVLSRNRLAHKLRGFIINKVIDDPTYVAQRGTGEFRSRNLAAIPFDLEATRSFLIGQLPSLVSPFGTHVWSALAKAYPALPPPAGRPWRPSDFKEIGFANLDALRGGVLLAAVISLLATLIGLNWASSSALLSNGQHNALVATAILLGIAAGLDPIRRAIGRAYATYTKGLSRMLFGSRTS